MTGKPDAAHVRELLLQALETERGGIKVYTAAIRTARNKDLKQEWEGYLEETRNHERILTRVFEAIGLDTEMSSPGRDVVAHHGDAELVAAECVVLAETKDHMNWELIGQVAEQDGPHADVLAQAHAAVETQEDHHLYHTRGWARELWIRSLGMPAVLPPPEEQKDVQTAIGAARAEKARQDYL